ncbi:nucleotidyl transferase AbiEii/AbiGii toxin family protein, partial [Myxococcota bacterium]|nr:nucleotidyl transferase AbiEii/AbiGii toxin family protein [Myxococcota bacterium]
TAAAFKTAVEGMEYQGLRYKAQGWMAQKIYGSPFGIDIAFAEPMLGEPEKIQGSTFLKFAGIEPALFRIYPLETHIAEKLHAYTVPRKRPNSRVKDFPDIALLATVRDIDGTALRSAIEQTFEHRATHPVPTSIIAPPNSWAIVYERIAANDGLQWSTLPELTRAVQYFLNPVLAGNAQIWKADEGRWTKP